MNRYLKVVLLSNGVFVLANSLLGPLWAIFVSGFATDIVYISSTASVNLITRSLVLFVLTKYGDSLKHPAYLLTANFLLRCVLWTGYIFATSIWTILALQILLGVTDALGSPAFDSLVAEHLDEGHHIKDYSEWQLLQSIVGAIGAFSGGIIVKEFGFDALLIVMIGFGLFATAILYFGLDGRFNEKKKLGV